MKKLLLAVGVAAAVSSIQSSFADTLRITNGQNDFYEVEINSFSYDSNSGRLTLTTNANLVVDGEAPAPAPEPNPEPEPEPEPSPEPEPGEGGSGDTSSCNDADVRCDYHIGNWSSHSGQTLVVGKGMTVSSKFTASTQKGRFDMVPSLYSKYPVYSFWVSSEPAGDPVPGCSIATNNLAFNLLWVTFASGGKYCELNSGGSYYINLRHADSNLAGTNVTRRLK